MHRRQFLKLMAVSGLFTSACEFSSREGIFNPCLSPVLPAHLLHHDLMQQIWDGIDPAQMWDSHVHIAGIGDSNSGLWLNPAMTSFTHPKRYAQYKFYLNAACVDEEQAIDVAYVNHLKALHAGIQKPTKLMLLAFDYFYNEDGSKDKVKSSFFVPNHYVARLAAASAEIFEWVASIHPYRHDALEELERVVQLGARAIKWLPPAMGIDPSSSRCMAFYDALVKYNLPLISHAGEERAVHVPGTAAYANPLLLRTALDRGVRVVVAHCASMGEGLDLDKQNKKTLRKLSQFSLFARMMDEPEYQNNLYGDISAMLQTNRLGEALDTVLQRDDWHPRLLNGSDYPLPGVMPVFSVNKMIQLDYLKPSAREFLVEIRRHNPLLFDFASKRLLQKKGSRFNASIFHTAGFFSR